jgi:hypothetical protein
MHAHGMARSVVSVGVVLAPIAIGRAASATSPATQTPLSGYVVEAGGNGLGPGSQIVVEPFCPGNDVVIGGGAYTSVQGIQESLYGSWAITGGTIRGWAAEFDNTTQTTMNATSIAICAASSSLVDYQVETGSKTRIPAAGTVLVTATCPSGLTALSGGWFNKKLEGTEAVFSGPDGTDGWQALVSGPSGQAAQAQVVCAKKPAGWVQVTSPSVRNDPGTATTATANCPAGTQVIAGGSTARSHNPDVTIGLTTPLSSTDGWNSTENNNSSKGDSITEWADCADT